MVVLLLVLLGFVMILFVPSLLEMKRPKDKGPRKIVKETLGKLNALSNVRALEGDLIKISGDVCFPSGFEMEENIVIEGSLTVGDRCHFHKSVKAGGDAHIGSDVIIDGNLVVDGGVDVGDGTVIGGSIDARSDAKLGEKVVVRFSLVSGGNVELFENSEVAKNILAQGVIKVLKQPRLGFPSTVEDIG
jgi:bifunctional N-acetylglucosamine-1-phosphate-uridyltransferase/glucosamine-1-phosphate-acetyltransferase GlmU-like protein